MKKFLIVLAAITLSGTGFARSMMPSILEYQQVAAPSDASAVKLQSLAVYVNGSVVASLRDGNGSKVVSVRQLDAAQVDRIIALAKDAQTGEVKRTAPHMACFVASPFTHKYTMEMGRTLLYSGHPCNGALLVNQAPAAKRLIAIVNQLRATAFPSGNLE